MQITLKLSALGILWAIAIGAARAEDSVSQAPTQQEITALIAQLGDDEYTARESASKKLVQIGLAAEPQLRQAQTNPDFEIRLRSARALRTIEASPASKKEHQIRVEAFAADTDGSQKLSLPGWEPFRQIVGDTPEARAFFAEMQLAQRSLLRAYEDGTLQVDPLSETLYDESCVKLGKPEAQPSWGAATAALLLVAADKKLKLPKQSFSQMTGVLQGEGLAKALSGTHGPLLRKLLVHWLRDENDMSVIYLVMQHNLEEAGLDMATRMLSGDDQVTAPFQKIFAFSLLGKFGNQEHTPLVEPLLEDESAMGEKVQLRDLALGVLLHLNGQKLGDYGFKEGIDFSKGFEGLGTALNDGFYQEGHDRDQAIAKWRAHSKAKPSPE